MDSMTRVRTPSGAHEKLVSCFRVKTVVLTRCRCAQLPCVHARIQMIMIVRALKITQCQSSVDYENTIRPGACVRACVRAPFTVSVVIAVVVVAFCQWVSSLSRCESLFCHFSLLIHDLLLTFWFMLISVQPLLYITLLSFLLSCCLFWAGGGGGGGGWLGVNKYLPTQAYLPSLFLRSDFTYGTRFKQHIIIIYILL